RIRFTASPAEMPPSALGSAARLDGAPEGRVASGAIDALRAASSPSGRIVCSGAVSVPLVVSSVTGAPPSRRCMWRPPGRRRRPILTGGPSPTRERGFGEPAASAVGPVVTIDGPTDGPVGAPVDGSARLVLTSFTSVPVHERFVTPTRREAPSLLGVQLRASS